MPLLFNMNRFFHISKKGFTLTEVMIVVAIITILASLGTYSWREVSRRAQANKIATDFRKIEGAWQLWRTDTHYYYPEEGDPTYAANRIPSLCGVAGPNNVPISETHLFQDVGTVNGLTLTWRGPYLSSLPIDPIGNEYVYDRDGTDDLAPGGIGGNGTNIAIEWCPEEDGIYNALLPILDRTFDSSDGNLNGKFRWLNGSNPRRMFYNIDVCKGIYAPCDP